MGRNLLSFQATEFEFRQRFWFIGVIFWAGFGLYSVDHGNAAIEVGLKILGPGVNTASPQLEHFVRGVLLAGTAVLVVAALIRSWAEAYLHSAVVHDMDLHSERLVADGPYRHVRNPLYLGNILLAFAMGPMASRIGFFVMAIGMTLFSYRLVLHEEAKMLATQGESFRKYMQAVPRLWPSLRARIPASGGKPNWADGFAGEIFFWSFAAGECAFALTLQLKYFWIIVGLGFAIYFLQGYLRKKK
jgi:protein-S-isoprenylcysteine O-methyltransferase Ste14